MPIKAAIIRGAIPLVIMSVISLILRAQGEESDQVRGTFFAGLIITAVAAASVIYDIEEWTLKRRSIVHFGVMAVTVLPVLLLSGWFALNSVADYLKVLGLFLLVGLIAWGLMLFIFTRFSAEK